MSITDSLLVPPGQRPRTIYRSAPMSLVQLYIPSEAAHATVSELGDLGLVQFRDLNVDVPALQKTFTGEIMKLAEMERKIQALTEFAEESDVMVRSWTFNAASSNGKSSNLSARRASKTPQEFNEIDQELTEYERRTLTMNESQRVLEKKLSDLKEYEQVLGLVSDFLRQAVKGELAASPNYDKDDQNDEEHGGADHFTTTTTSVGFVVGIVLRRKFTAFERVLWRAMRGNIYLNKADVTNVDLGEFGIADPSKDKSVFIAFAHGAATLTKIRRICEALGCRVFGDVDEDSGRRQLQITQVRAQIDDLSSILFNTRQTKRAELAKVAESLDQYAALVTHQKGVYAVMNLFHYDASRKCLIAEAWCPTESIPHLDDALHTASDRVGLDVSSIMTVLKTDLAPPTYFPTNKFTEGFQEMTDAYGVADYGEANPTLFMIITFPFLFAIMFGDVGHAVFMLLAALAMILFEKRMREIAAKSEIFGMMFAGRYIILLMGLFSIYVGFIYNDIFSKSMNLFDSMFFYNAEDGTSVPKPDQVYPFGVDPLWNHAENNLSFTNSYKMKQSIVLGVIHMSVGLVVGATNYWHERDWVSITCHFIPQFLFMTSLFGYLSFLIVYKWCANVPNSILNTFITMVLGLGAVEGKEMYVGQELVQKILLAIAVICVPWMLLGRPLYTLYRKRQIQSLGYAEAVSRGSGDSLSSTQHKALASGDDEDSESIGAMLVNEAIHTIEFVLGSVSNTASYLRLWALSLAHAQLSEVLWTLVIEICLVNPVMLIFGFAAWLAFSIAVMVMMEGLSAFLHALRLHWVEFNNKFFRGNGVKFVPFKLDVQTGELVLIPAVSPVGSSH